MEGKRYQIRQVLGKYWLVDTEADGMNYRLPPTLNDTGVYIWKRMEKGKSAELIAADLHNDLGADEEEAKADVEDFMETMAKLGIKWEG